jgi:hypothetical protein
MSNNLHDPDSAGRPIDHNNRMPDDPGGGGTGAKRPPAGEGQGESAIEAFDEEGAGIAPKE